jgi:putative restriction endonuclease
MVEEKVPTEHELLVELDSLQVATINNERAPYKPLLLLKIVNRSLLGQSPEIPFCSIKEDLRRVMQEFGRTANAGEAILPFWHLKSSRLWSIINEELIPLGANKKRPTLKTMEELNVTGKVNDDFWANLKKEKFRQKVLARLLSYWPENYHEDILTEFGINEPVESKRQRDPHFRKSVLEVYDAQCVVCGFDGQLSYTPIGVEAAHIKWHMRGGPSDLNNGIALCSLHHKAFDRGAISFDKNRKLIVSTKFKGSHVASWILKFKGQKMAAPKLLEAEPLEEYLEWHRRNVFKEPSRS